MIKEQINIDEQDLGFGKIHTEHILTVDYDNEQWGTYAITPFKNIELSPLSQVFHYGQSIFEGLKAYRNKKNEIKIFRLEEHFNRMNLSAYRMSIPHIPKNIFVDGIKELIRKDQDWVPDISKNISLYIRPVAFATEPLLRVSISKTYKFMVILSPVTSYFTKPVNILVEDRFVRASVGGTGEAKTGGNYAATYLPTQLCVDKGYDQILWTDPADNHKTIQEIGAMNIFFVMNNKVVTPKLDGAVLDGITRKSIIDILKHKGYEVEERKILIDEIVYAYDHGDLQEMWGSGTAAIISDIASLTYQGKKMTLDHKQYDMSNMLKQEIFSIRNGEESPFSHWMESL